MKSVGLLGGSFDPPHKGHLYISKIAIKKFTEASIELLKVADDQNLENTIAAFRKVAGTCKGCHKQFRN